VALVHAGTLPVSVINVGLAASVPALAAELAILEADLTSIGLASAGDLEVSFDFPPNPIGAALAIAASNNPLEVAANIAAGPIAGTDLSLEVAAELAFVELQLGVANTVSSSLGAGLESGDIGGFSYAGGALDYGRTLSAATAPGFGTFAPGTTVQAVVIACEDFSAWASFSEGCRTNAPATPAATGDARLAYLGELGGGEWNTGVADVMRRLRFLLLDLEGQKSTLEAQLEFSLGLGSIDADFLVDTGVEIVAELGIDGLLENMVEVNADFDVALEGGQLKIDAVLALIADLNSQLSAGGLSFWTYSGPAGTLGAALHTELVNGLPGGSGPNAVVYGLTLVGAPPAMATFGNIFKVT
jgi:hypothetical protein